MKKARLVIAMVIVAMMTSMFSFASADAVKIGVKADKTEVSVGDEVVVSYIVPEGGLMALQIGAKWDDTKLKLVSAEKGDAFELTAMFDAAVNGGAGAVCTQLAMDPAKAGAVVFTAKFEVLATDAEVTAYIEDAVDAAEVTIADAEAETVKFTEYVAPSTTAPTTEAPATTAAPTTAAPTTVETKAEVDDNPNTGVVACTAAVVALAASGVVLVKSKRK